MLGGTITTPVMKPTKGKIFHAKNNGSHNPIWGFIQDVGYGVANIFGQGETADKLINSIDHYIFGGPKHLSATELIKQITEKYGTTISKARQFISLLDKKANQLETAIANLDNDSLKKDIDLSNLPPALSSNVRKIVQKRMNELNEGKLANEKSKMAIQKQKESIANERNKIATDLTKIESDMGLAQNLASQQDMLSPSRKASNQEQLNKLMDQQPNMSYLDNIERSIK